MQWQVLNNLVLLTSQFPYGNKESFLEDELLYLSKSFKYIYIFATSDASTIRKVPDNCQIISLPKFVKFKSNKLLIFNLKIWYVALSFLFKEWALNDEFKKFKHIKPQLKKSFFMSSVFHWLNQNTYQNIFENSKIIYSYWSDPLALAYLKYGNSINKNKLVIRAHSSDTYKLLKPQYLKNSLFKSVEKIYGISDLIKDHLTKDWQVESSKVAVSRLGTGIKPYQGKDFNVTELNIISCSYINKLKRVDNIAKAIIALQKELKSIDISWTHIGGGEDFQKIKELVKDSAIKTNLTGNIAPSIVKEMLHNENFHIFINNSTSEGIPVSVMEAFGAGIPAICTNVGATNELVKNDLNGYLIDLKGSTNELTKKLIYFYNLKAIKKKDLSFAAYSTVKKYYNLENYKSFAEDIAKLN